MAVLTDPTCAGPGHGFTNRTFMGLGYKNDYFFQAFMPLDPQDIQLAQVQLCRQDIIDPAFRDIQVRMRDINANTRGNRAAKHSPYGEVCPQGL